MKKSLLFWVVSLLLRKKQGKEDRARPLGRRGFLCRFVLMVWLWNAFSLHQNLRPPGHLQSPTRRKPEKSQKSLPRGVCFGLFSDFFGSGVGGSQTPLGGHFFETFRVFGVLGSVDGGGDPKPKCRREICRKSSQNICAKINACINQRKNLCINRCTNLHIHQRTTHLRKDHTPNICVRNRFQISGRANQIRTQRSALNLCKTPIPRMCKLSIGAKATFLENTCMASVYI